ncbi:MAG: hypothetical protein K2N11_05835, partial [Mucispirillum sp.]|nr:hypothetical protein [Mucispirillum sp.]
AMKKFLFLVVLSVFMAAGCSDSDDGNGGNSGNTIISSLQGTYDIEFFYTDGGGLAVITTDCDKAIEYGGTTSCEKGYLGFSPVTSVEHKGEVTITVNEDNSIKVQSKVEMYDTTGSNDAFDMVKQLGANYNFTDFNVIPSNAVSTAIINDPATENNVKGVHGRNATSIIPYNEATEKVESEGNAAYSEYQFTVLEDGTLVNKMKDTSSYADANVIIRMKKRSNEVITLDANTPYDSTRTDNFNNNVKYTPSN